MGSLRRLASRLLQRKNIIANRLRLLRQTLGRSQKSENAKDRKEQFAKL